MKLNRMTQQLMGLVIVSCLLQAKGFSYSGGQGTKAFPYALSSKEDIIELASHPEDYDKSFILTDDVDMDGVVFEGAIISPNILVNPSFGEYECLFTGCFNGNGHVIENLTLTGKGALGFVGGIGRTGRVMHLGLRDVSIDGPGASYVGMLGGVNMGVIVGCYAQGDVTGHSSVGGLVGYQLSGHIIDCFSPGSVKGVAGGVGGLVGILWQGRIHRCYAASVLSSEDLSGLGGLLGMPTSGGRGTPSRIVTDSFWDVEVSGLSTSSGGIGLSTKAMCDVSTYVDAGWDFAEEQGNGINDIWMQSAEGGYPTLSTFAGMGPVSLAGEGSKDNPYVVSTAKELAAMVYYNDGSCFALVGDIDLSGIEWSVPVLTEFDGYLDGHEHCISGFYQSGSCGLFGVIENGATVANLSLEKSELKTEDNVIGALAGENYGDILNCSVTGIIAGGTVTGGLVGYNEGTISKCSFSGMVKGDERAGGLAGENAGTMLNDSSQGVVTGDGNVGGIAGSNDGSIRSCYSLAAITGYLQLGGLIGCNDGTVTDCYARGVVAGGYCIGGLIGSNSSDVSRCYSTGAVLGLEDLGGLMGSHDLAGEVVSNSFWDIDTSGISESVVGTGVTSNQMQDIDTFLEAGWDFVEETVNGTSDLWIIGDDNYPDLTLSLEVTGRIR